MALNNVPVTKRSFNTRLGVSSDLYRDAANLTPFFFLDAPTRYHSPLQ